MSEEEIQGKLKKEGGITKLPRTEKRYGVYGRYNFGEPPVRHAVKDLSSDIDKVKLFKTVANPEAVEELKKYIGFQEEECGDWEVREFREDEERGDFLSMGTKGSPLSFNFRLFDLYERAIDKMADERVGKERYARYPTVFRTHSHSKDPKALYWPKRHMVDSEKEDELKEVIESFAGKEGFEAAKEEVSKQKYKMAEVKKLYETGINPFLIMDDELELERDELSKHVDFLTHPIETDGDNPKLSYY